MPVSHKHKVILVHIPKTGGTSIESALGMHAARDDIGLAPYKLQKRDYHNLYGGGMQHMMLTDFKHYYNAVNFNNYESFGGVKHFIDVVIKILGLNHTGVAGNNIFDEYFKFAVVRNPYDRLVSHFSWRGGKWHKNIEPNKEDFIKFVRRMIENKLYKTDLHLIPQYKYIVDDDGVTAVDHVLHIENLANEFSSLCTELNIKAELKKEWCQNTKVTFVTIMKIFVSMCTIFIKKILSYLVMTSYYRSG